MTSCGNEARSRPETFECRNLPRSFRANAGTASAAVRPHPNSSLRSKYVMDDREQDASGRLPQMILAADQKIFVERLADFIRARIASDLARTTAKVAEELAETTRYTADELDKRNTKRFDHIVNHYEGLLSHECLLLYRRFKWLQLMIVVTWIFLGIDMAVYLRGHAL